MNVSEAIEKRRAYRSLEPIEVTESLINDLAYHAGLSPSCNNYQPWRFVFIHNQEQLKKIHATLSKNNKWIELASMIVAVFSKVSDDCVVKDRIYNQFDTGMATAFLILRATELDLVAHPVAGYNEEAIKQILNIPDTYQVITLVNIGKHSKNIHPYLTEKQAIIELQRPSRLPFEKFVHINEYKNSQNQK